MTNVLKKMIMVLTVVLFAASAYTNEKQAQTKESCESCTCCEKEAFPDVCGYNCPATMDIKCGWNFYLDGSFLYWQALEEGMDVGAYVENPLNNEILLPNIKTVDFKYHPAFKVALGAVSNYDKWNFNLQYTRYTAKNHGSFSNSTLPNFISDYYDSLVYIESSSIISMEAQWKLDLNIVDFDMGRQFFVGQQLIFNPFIGIKGGKLDQKAIFTTTTVPSDTGLSAPSPDSTYYYFDGKLKTWLIGPRVGINSTWRLGCGFRIFGNAAASLVYQNMKAPLSFVVPVQATLSTAHSFSCANKVDHVTSIFESIIGFGWGSYFNDKSWHFDLAAGYEFQSYLSQQGFIMPIAEKAVPNGNLSLHGLTVVARVDF